MAFRAPLLGYNTNVRHKGRLYHIQTEDSGIGHPHVITHLFADGGRIVASKKTGYAEHLGADNLQETVKKLMQAQHKAMFIALRDCVYDEPSSEEQPQPPSEVTPIQAAARPPASAPAAERKPLYQGTVAAKPTAAASAPMAAAVSIAASVTPAPVTPTPARQSIFGSDLVSEKSLDEVILSYLATDDVD